jgi:hypothetical protein
MDFDQLTAAAATSASEPAPAARSPLQQGALLQACRAVLRPLAKLAVGRGLPFGDIVEVLKQCFVEAALAAHPGVAPHRAVSRISAATGLNRREVTRLMQGAGAEAPARPSPATQAFTRWLSDSAFLRADGAPAPLRLQGPAPSFESLAHSVTRDVHPRSLLEELTRLGLAQLDEADGCIHLLQTAFVPRADRDRMLSFLGDNVGDHLEAAVANVLVDGSRHFEQALFADELSEASPGHGPGPGQRAVAATAAHAGPGAAGADRRRQGGRAAGRPAPARRPVRLHRRDGRRRGLASHRFPDTHPLISKEHHPCQICTLLPSGRACHGGAPSSPCWPRPAWSCCPRAAVGAAAAGLRPVASTPAAPARSPPGASAASAP